MRKDNTMTLKDAENGKEYIVEGLTLKQPIKRRLEAMGLIEGTMIRKIDEALDGSIIFMVRGTRLAIGRELAELVMVRDVSESEMRQKRHRNRCCGKGPRNGRGKGGGRGRKRGAVVQAEKRGEAVDSE